MTVICLRFPLVRKRDFNGDVCKAYKWGKLHFYKDLNISLAAGTRRTPRKAI